MASSTVLCAQYVAYIMLINEMMILECFKRYSFRFQVMPFQNI